MLGMKTVVQVVRKILLLCAEQTVTLNKAYLPSVYFAKPRFLKSRYMFIILTK